MFEIYQDGKNHFVLGKCENFGKDKRNVTLHFFSRAGGQPMNKELVTVFNNYTNFARLKTVVHDDFM